MKFSPHRLKRHISLSGAVFSLLFAAALPLLTPQYQQLEILVVAFWFALMGALLLNSAGVFGQQAQLMPLKLLAGAGLGIFGFGAPWWMGRGADARFYWMIALGPLAVAGAVLMWSGLGLREAADKPTQARHIPSPKTAHTPVGRAASGRVPAPGAWSWLLPVALALMALAIMAVLITVLGPALGAFLR